MTPLDWYINEAFAKRSDAYAITQVLRHIPEFVSEDDPRPAHEQFGERYIGGWNPMLPAGERGFALGLDNYLLYPGDPPLPPLASAYLREELILVYPHAWVVVVQPDQSFQVVRMD